MVNSQSETPSGRSPGRSYLIAADANQASVFLRFLVFIHVDVFGLFIDINLVNAQE